MLTIDTTITSLQVDGQEPVQEKVTAKHKGMTVVICGQCGAEEKFTSGNQTECPNCDDYIY